MCWRRVWRRPGSRATRRRGARPSRSQWWTAGCWIPRARWRDWRRRRGDRTGAAGGAAGGSRVGSGVRDRGARSGRGQACRESRAQKLNARVMAANARVDGVETADREAGERAPADDRRRRQLELAKAQLALDEDELEDARLDLAREGGDERGRLEQAARDHAAAQKDPAPVVRPAAVRTDTLGDQVVAWWTLTTRRAQVRGCDAEGCRSQAVGRGGAQDPGGDGRRNPAPSRRRRAAMRGWRTTRRCWRACTVSRTSAKRSRNSIGGFRIAARSWRPTGSGSQSLETRRRGVLHVMLGRSPGCWEFCWAWWLRKWACGAPSATRRTAAAM